jgi:MoxR-like ATPase
MQERQVTAGGERHDLDLPFFVLATQNPIEQEGTYPLPEAQLDRFMMLIHVGYPTEDEEMKILDLTTTGYAAEIKPVLTGPEIVRMQQLVRNVNISEAMMRTIVRLVRKTRVGEPEARPAVNKWVSWGASPRACQSLVLGAKANAILDGRNEVKLADILEVARAVLNHRIMVNFAARAEGVTPVHVIDELLKETA